MQIHQSEGDREWGAEGDDIHPEKPHRGPHHIRPRSRCGEKKEINNRYPKERWRHGSKKHDYWHVLFANLTPKEAMNKIEKYTNADGSLQEVFFATFFCVDEKNRDMGIKTDDVYIREVYHLLRFEQRKDAWHIVFGDMNAREAVEWIKREFIDKEWLPEELERRRVEKEQRKSKRRKIGMP